LILGPEAAEARRRSRTRVALVPLFASGKGATKVARKTTRAMVKRMRKNRRLRVVMISHRRARRMKQCLQIPECIQKVGRHLRVRYLIAGHVTRLGRRYHVDMRVMARASGEVISNGTFRAGNLWRAKARGVRMAYSLVRKARRGVRVAAASTTATDAVPSSSSAPLFSRSEAEAAANTVEARDEENPLVPPEEKAKEKKLAGVQLSPDSPIVAAPTVVKRDEPGFFSRVATKRYWHAWTTAGVGLAALGAGVGFGVISMKANTTAKNAEYQREAWLNRDKAKKNGLVANILYGAGGAAMLTSAVMFMIEYRKESREKRNENDLSIDFQVAQQGGGVVVKGSF
jgi:TolB-like protein